MQEIMEQEESYALCRNGTTDGSFSSPGEPSTWFKDTMKWEAEFLSLAWNLVGLEKNSVSKLL